MPSTVLKVVTWINHTMNCKTPIYLTADIRKIEQLAAALPNPSDLMAKPDWLQQK